MKIDVTRKEEVEVSFVEVIAAVRYDEDDMPNDFPGRIGDTWRVRIAIDNGDLYVGDKPFPKEVTHHLHMKTTDQCTVRLLDHVGDLIVERENDYVPGFFPGTHFGDYIIFNIERGKVTNWHPHADKVQAAFALSE